MSVRPDTQASSVPTLFVGEPDDRSSAAHAIRWALADALNRLVRHEAGVRTGNDPEDVHQARVATRRFRAILREFRDLCATTWVDTLRTDVKALSDQLGAVRDADIVIGRVLQEVEALGPEDLVAGRSLYARLTRTRTKHRDRLVRTLCSPRYQELLDAMHDAVRKPQLTEGCEDTAAMVLLPYARRAWRRVKLSVQDLGRQPSDRELHLIRIATKRARYTGNVLAPSVGKPAARFVRAAGRLQDVLGDHQDAVITQAWLRRDSAEAEPSEALVAGQLIVSERTAAAKLREKWPENWRRLDRKRVTEWLAG